jgi:hypothetical protein
MELDYLLSHQEQIAADAKTVAMGTKSFLVRNGVHAVFEVLWVSDGFMGFYRSQHKKPIEIF